MVGVAFAVATGPNADLDKIYIVDNWGAKMGNAPKIPSVYSYSPKPDTGEEQWGSSLSADAVAMILTKLELDTQEKKSDELEFIIRALDGMENLHFEHIKKVGSLPDYTWKEPEEIVTDYLSKIYEHVMAQVTKGTRMDAGNPQLRSVQQAMTSKIPIDIVITVPVVRNISSTPLSWLTAT